MSISFEKNIPSSIQKHAEHCPDCRQKLDVVKTNEKALALLQTLTEINELRQSTQAKVDFFSESVPSHETIAFFNSIRTKTAGENSVELQLRLLERTAEGQASSLESATTGTSKVSREIVSAVANHAIPRTRFMLAVLSSSIHRPHLISWHN